MTLTSLLVFMLPVESGEKVSLSVTVLLSYFVLLLVVTDVTPKHSSALPYLSTFFTIFTKYFIDRHRRPQSGTSVQLSIIDDRGLSLVSLVFFLTVNNLIITSSFIHTG